MSLIFNNITTEVIFHKALEGHIGVWIDISEWSNEERTELSNYLEKLYYDVLEQYDFIPKITGVIHIWGFTAQRYIDCYIRDQELHSELKKRKVPEFKWSLKGKTLYPDIWS